MAAPGVGVDSHGGPLFDPTKNVGDLVEAAGKYQDGMRDAESRMQNFARDSLEKFQNFARESESKMQSWMRDAETKRVDQLGALRQDYDKRIADMLAESVKSTSSLVSTQLLQIQGTFGERLNKLEEFRLTSQGRASVADPQLASSLANLSSGIGDMQTAFAKTVAELTRTNAAAMDTMASSITKLNTAKTGAESQNIGRREVVAWIFAAVTAAGVIATIVFELLKH
jgi:hypothetical protein